MMKYRGHRIEAKLERMMGGTSAILFGIYRLPDQYECDSGFEYHNDVRRVIDSLKRRVDLHLDKGLVWGEF